MITTVPFTTRPEYSRLERYYELGRLYLALGEPEKAIGPLERYVKWMPADARAVAVKEEARLQLQAVPQI